MTKKLLYNLPAIVGALLLAWIALSYFDIVLDNTSVAPVHSNYNLFILLEEVAAK
jgi:hypothetical protein